MNEIAVHIFLLGKIISRVFNSTLKYVIIPLAHFNLRNKIHVMCVIVVLLGIIVVLLWIKAIYVPIWHESKPSLMLNIHRIHRVTLTRQLAGSNILDYVLYLYKHLNISLISQLLLWFLNHSANRFCFRQSGNKMSVNVPSYHSRLWLISKPHCRALYVMWILIKATILNLFLHFSLVVTYPSFMNKPVLDFMSIYLTTT